MKRKAFSTWQTDELTPGLALGQNARVLRKPQPSAVVLPARKKSVGFWLFLAGLNGFFVLPFFFSHSALSGPGLGTWRYSALTYLCMVLGGLLELYRSRGRLLRYAAYRRWFWLFLAILAQMVIRSWIIGEPILNILWNTVFYFSLLTIGFLGQDRTNWPILNRVLVAHTLIQSTYTLWVIWTTGITTRMDVWSFERANTLSAGLYAFPVLLYSFTAQTKSGKLAAGLGYLAYAVSSLVGQNRGAILFLGVHLLILTFILQRTQKLSKARFLLAVTLIGVLSFAVYNVVRSSDSSLAYRLAEAQGLTYQRFTREGGVLETLMSDFRWEEARILSEQLTWDEWLLGRGVAATWSDPRAYWGMQRSMVHLGYLHYIFHGGVFFATLVLLIPFTWGMRAMLKSGDEFTVAAGGFVVQCFLGSFGHGLISPSLGWVVLALAIGRCAASLMQPSDVVQRDNPISNQV